jgi:hypothetical protein
VSVPKIIHQLWKDQHVPARYQPLADTWKRHHPNWSYKLWTDADIHALVAAEYPDFLPIFDAYKDPICRADAGRYLILRSQGGIYADLDLECLRPIDALLTKPQLYIAQEPQGHLGAANVQAGRFDKLLCPTFIACPPMHPFWDHFLLALIRARNEIDPLDATGPFVMTRAFDAFEQADSIALLASNTFYPFTKDECWDGQIFDIEYWEQATRQAYGVHYWDGSWFRNCGKPLAPFPEKLSGRVVQGTATSPATPLTGGELVSCVLLLADRTDLMAQSIDMFRRQSYGPRELLVIDRQAREDVAKDIARLNDPRIRIIKPTENQNSLSRIVADDARGTHVCLWTDATLSDPNRLASQMAAIKAANARACMLDRILIWHPAQGRLAATRQGIWISSLVCEKSIFPTDAQRAEGLGAWREHYGAILLNLPRLHMRCINLLNPSPIEPIWAQTKPPYEAARYDSVLTELAKTLPIEAYGRILEQPLHSAIFQKKPTPGLSADTARVLVLTPVKNASRYLQRYFELLSRLDYNPDLMSLGILEGDSDDTTYDDIAAHLPDLRQRMQKVTLVKQDFGQRIDGPRWAVNVQRRRRETLARARNRLLSETLRDEDWVLWLDVDLIDYPPDLLRRLMASGKDIMVPRCDLPDGRDYDLNSFRFDPAKGPAEDPRFLIDGIYQPQAGQGRAYLSELAGGQPAQIDCVGGTALLIRADLHREGLIFPAYSHRGYIETEGLAMIAKDMGYSCWALPDLRIVHSPD